MKNTEKIYIKIGESYGGTEISSEAVDNRKSHECTGGLKMKYKDSETIVCLKEYDADKLHPFDLDVINHHVIRKTADGTSYFDFTRDMTLEAIRVEKTMFLGDKRRKHHYVDAENSIFSPATTTIHVPEKIIPAHDETKGLYWNCSDDTWAED